MITPAAAAVLALLAAAAAALAAAAVVFFKRVLPLERELAERKRREDVHAREVRALYDVAETLSAPGRGVTALSAIVTIVARALDADLVAFLLLDEAAGELVVQPGAYGLGREGQLYRLSLSEEGSSSVRVFKSGVPFLCGDAQNDPGVIARYAKLWRMRSLMVVPVRREGRAIGVLRAGSFQPDRFTREDLELLAIVADEAGALLESALLNKKLAEAMEQLQAANRMKDEFVSVVSHEFKTPLTTILGFLSVMLEGEAGAVSEQQRKFLDAARTAARRLNALVGELLDLSRLQSTARLELQPLSVAQLLRSSVDAHRAQAEEGRRTLSLNVPESLPRVLGDARWLSLAADNLLSNALKFTRPGGRIAVSAEVREGGVLVSVEDDGVGIAKEEQPRVFDRFYRAKHSLERGVPGTGLGLAIAREAVQKHGGRIWVESEPGKGSRFCFLVPLAPAPARPLR